jgi:hypothetical protein
MILPLTHAVPLTKCQWANKGKSIKTTHWYTIKSCGKISNIKLRHLDVILVMISKTAAILMECCEAIPGQMYQGGIPDNITSVDANMTKYILYTKIQDVLVEIIQELGLMLIVCI